MYFELQMKDQIAEVMGSNPVQASIFFRRSFRNCLSFVLTARIFLLFDSIIVLLGVRVYQPAKKGVGDHGRNRNSALKKCQQFALPSQKSLHEIAKKNRRDSRSTVNPMFPSHNIM